MVASDDAARADTPHTQDAGHTPDRTVLDDKDISRALTRITHEILERNRDSTDVVLLGISRTSKTPTSIYLANRGVRTANVPLVMGIPVPAQLESLQKPLVVGLQATPDRIVQIRQNRLIGLGAHMDDTQYVDRQSVAEEVAYSRKLCAKHGWPTIDVTRRSIEETAAAILKLLADRKRQAV